MARVSLCRNNNCSGIYINDILVTLSLACAFLPFLIQLDNEFKLITVWPISFVPNHLQLNLRWSGAHDRVAWGHEAVESTEETLTGPLTQNL
jgi:hypothetical protein